MLNLFPSRCKVLRPLRGRCLNPEFSHSRLRGTKALLFVLAIVAFALQAFAQAPLWTLYSQHPYRTLARGRRVGPDSLDSQDLPRPTIQRSTLASQSHNSSWTVRSLTSGAEWANSSCSCCARRPIVPVNASRQLNQHRKGRVNRLQATDIASFHSDARQGAGTSNDMGQAAETVTRGPASEFPLSPKGSKRG